MKITSQSCVKLIPGFCEKGKFSRRPKYR